MSSPARPESGWGYVVAWLALLLLTALSFGFDHLPLGRLSLPASLCVAAVKVSIVLWIFMHLRQAPFGIRFIAVLNAGWVVMICLGIAADVAAR